MSAATCPVRTGSPGHAVQLLHLRRHRSRWIEKPDQAQYGLANVVGISIRSGAVNNRVQSNVVRNNNKMHVLTPGGSDDSGAFGISCAVTIRTSPITRSLDPTLFVRLRARRGSGGDLRWQIQQDPPQPCQEERRLHRVRQLHAADNTFAYNVVTSTLATSVFVVTRGSGNRYGPVYRTRLYNNSVLFTGAPEPGLCLQFRLQQQHSDHAQQFDPGGLEGGLRRQAVR